MVLAPRGLREREEGGLEKIEDADERRRLIKQTMFVHLQALAVAGAITAAMLLVG